MTECTLELHLCTEKLRPVFQSVSGPLITDILVTCNIVTSQYTAFTHRRLYYGVTNTSYYGGLMQKLTLWPNQTFNSQKKEKYKIQLTFQLWPPAFIIVKVDSFMTNISSQSRFQIMSDAIMDANYFPEMIKNVFSTKLTLDSCQ